LVDRIARHAHVLDMSGPSYRLKETKGWAAKKQDARTPNKNNPLNNDLETMPAESFSG